MRLTLTFPRRVWFEANIDIAASGLLVKALDCRLKGLDTQVNHENNKN